MKKNLLLGSLIALLFTGCVSMDSKIPAIRETDPSEILRAQKKAIDYIINSESFTGGDLDILSAERQECETEDCFIIRYRYTKASEKDSFRLRDILAGELKLEDGEVKDVKESVELTDQSYQERGLSSIKDPENCDLEKYGLDCAKTKFLEENLAWQAQPNGIDFCAYETLAVQDNNSYLLAFCEEFYLQDEKIICPDKESKQICFLSKDPDMKECREQCEFLETEPYLTRGSGVVIAVRLTEKDRGFELWQPRDGSLYMKDFEENFIPEAREKFQDADRGRLNATNIERAEEYFGIPASFEVSEDMDTSCEVYADCGMLPFSSALRSDCPHEVKCLNNQCVAGCYDFHDYTQFPQVKEADK